MASRRRLPPTPLEKVVGFDVAEEVYDRLDIVEQVILDLKIMEVTEQVIGLVLGISQTTVNIYMRRIRAKLANSKLHLILEARQHYRETHPIVVEQEIFEEVEQ